MSLTQGFNDLGWYLFVKRNFSYESHRLGIREEEFSHKLIFEGFEDVVSVNKEPFVFLIKIEEIIFLQLFESKLRQSLEVPVIFLDHLFKISL